MRIIYDPDTDKVLAVSFGAAVTCNGVDCVEYEGEVPSGYESLEDWYLKEADKLYRWKLGYQTGSFTVRLLVLDSEAVAPTAAGTWQKLTYSPVNFEDDGTCVYRRQGDLVEIRFYLKTKIDLTASTSSNPRQLCRLPDEIVPKTYMVRDTGVYVGAGTRAPGRLIIYNRGAADEGLVKFWGFPDTISAGGVVAGHAMYFI